MPFKNLMLDPYRPRPNVVLKGPYCYKFCNQSERVTKLHISEAVPGNLPLPRQDYYLVLPPRQSDVEVQLQSASLTVTGGHFGNNVFEMYWQKRQLRWELGVRIDVGDERACPPLFKAKDLDCRDFDDRENQYIFKRYHVFGKLMEDEMPDQFKGIRLFVTQPGGLAGTTNWVGADLRYVRDDYHLEVINRSGKAVAADPYREPLLLQLPPGLDGDWLGYTQEWLTEKLRKLNAVVNPNIFQRLATLAGQEAPELEEELRRTPRRVDTGVSELAPAPEHRQHPLDEYQEWMSAEDFEREYGRPEEEIRRLTEAPRLGGTGSSGGSLRSGSLRRAAAAPASTVDFLALARAQRAAGGGGGGGEDSTIRGPRPEDSTICVRRQPEEDPTIRVRKPQEDSTIRRRRSDEDSAMRVRFRDEDAESKDDDQLGSGWDPSQTLMHTRDPRRHKAGFQPRLAGLEEEEGREVIPAERPRPKTRLLL